MGEAMAKIIGGSWTGAVLRDLTAKGLKGWRIERMWEVKVSVIENGSYATLGYFINDEGVAKAFGKSKERVTPQAETTLGKRYVVLTDGQVAFKLADVYTYLDDEKARNEIAQDIFLDFSPDVAKN
jgi:hypothetical protein